MSKNKIMPSSQRNFDTMLCSISTNTLVLTAFWCIKLRPLCSSHQSKLHISCSKCKKTTIVTSPLGRIWIFFILHNNFMVMTLLPFRESLEKEVRLENVAYSVSSWHSRNLSSRQKINAFRWYANGNSWSYIFMSVAIKNRF